MGPPASGKTNIVDLISLALEEYSKHRSVKLYSFYFRYENDEGRVVEFRPKLRQNPILLFPTNLRLDDETTHPRQELFEYINSQRGEDEKIIFPTYYQNAYVDQAQPRHHRKASAKPAKQ